MQNGGSLTIAGGSLGAGTVGGGTPGGGGGAGQGLGQTLFIQNGQSLTLAPTDEETLNIAGGVADQGAGGPLVVLGPGKVRHHSREHLQRRRPTSPAHSSLPPRPLPGPAQSSCTRAASSSSTQASRSPT